MSTLAPVAEIISKYEYSIRLMEAVMPSLGSGSKEIKRFERNLAEARCILAALKSAPVAEPAGNDISYVYQICNRYESGYGHGIKRDGLDLSKTPHADSVMGEAYQIGYEAGSEKFTEPTPQDQALQELAEREAFSRWAMLEGNDEMYLKSAWEGWQAALQSRPKLSDYVIADIIEKLNPFYASYSDAHQEKWVECARAVIAADREMK